MKKFLAVILLLTSLDCLSQQSPHLDSLRKVYLDKQKLASKQFESDYYPNRPQIYSLDEKQFLSKVQSLKAPFEIEANKYKKQFGSIDEKFITAELRDIEYFFDRIIQDYPYFHENHTGNKVTLSKPVQKKLDKHLQDFNNPALLSNVDIKGYIEGFLRHLSSIEVKKERYQHSDNKRLDAYLNLIPKHFTNEACKEYWQYHYLFAHIDDWGSKNIGAAVQLFLSTCKNLSYVKTIDSMYTESSNSYKGHLIKTYKTVGPSKLDLHIFLPDSSYQKTKRPVIVFFSGGSWTKGTPEWDFYNCANYAKKGWVAVAVEYRIADRHETTPFESVKDAKTAIRWLRMNSAIYNIDSNRVVATGNSAGGHLVLATALANEVNENTDNLNFSASPNLLLVNSGVYSLYADGSTDWISKELKDKTLVKKISPQHLLKKGLPPMLIIHGTNDNSVAYSSAKTFAEEMRQLGNQFEFETLEGAPHYIWYDRRFSGKVAGFRKEFLRKYGYE
jgi:acetyl esterase/lipase